MKQKRIWTYKSAAKELQTTVSNVNRHLREMKVFPTTLDYGSHRHAGGMPKAHVIGMDTMNKLRLTFQHGKEEKEEC